VTNTDADAVGAHGLLDVLATTQANTDVDELLHVVRDNAATVFTWDYQTHRAHLGKLYEKAKVGQWNASTDLDWSVDVDQELQVSLVQAAMGGAGVLAGAYDDTPLGSWGPQEWLTFGVEQQNWLLSQFMHGEQGALICTAKIVETVPWYDAKLYASTQVMDEARHVEVFARYLDTKLSGHYPINAHLRLLLDEIIADSRWDMTYLGMQIMVEGLALAAFGFQHQLTQEPLLKSLLRYVMSDEARHVAFGVLTLREVYADMTAAEIRERQEFAFEAAILMRNRFLYQEVWERMGIDTAAVLPALINDPVRRDFQQLLFSKIVPNCKKLGLLDAGDGWLRARFEDLGVLRFEDLDDTSSEYGKFALEVERSLAE
jgi:hypothetical protein